MSEQELPTLYRVQTQNFGDKWGNFMFHVPPFKTREEAQDFLDKLQWKNGKKAPTRVIEYDRWEQYEDACRRYDKWYMMSDDPRVYSEGPAKNAHAKRLRHILVKEDKGRAEEIFARLAH